MEPDHLRVRAAQLPRRPDRRPLPGTAQHDARGDVRRPGGRRRDGQARGEARQDQVRVGLQALPGPGGERRAGGARGRQVHHLPTRQHDGAMCAATLWEPKRNPCPRSIDHVPHLPSMREAHSSSRAPHTPPPPPPRDTDLSLKTAERSGCWATNPAAQREHAECQQPRQTELGDDWPAFEEEVERWCACAMHAPRMSLTHAVALHVACRASPCPAMPCCACDQHARGE